MVINFLTYRFLSLIIAILYPSYQTYKSLKYQLYDQYRPLLSYWIIFTLVQVSEFFFDPLISLIVPFYYEFKLVFLLGLTHRNLSEFIFNTFLRSFIDKYEGDIDYLLNNTVHRLAEVIFRSLVFILHQQQRIFHSNEHPKNSLDTGRLKTNFASQCRRSNSFQRH